MKFQIENQAVAAASRRVGGHGAADQRLIGTGFSAIVGRLSALAGSRCCSGM
ncbi:hypothetical protein [Novosphingobium sediminis]|uniref:hypothetical protein n=1 Tax=Novosphingobium sediminis TaxID=707214 RepID=UPI001478272D|nr:hypothetical protein [Novosphingobium sediminis]